MRGGREGGRGVVGEFHNLGVGVGGGGEGARGAGARRGWMVVWIMYRGSPNIDTSDQLASTLFHPLPIPPFPFPISTPSTPYTPILPPIHTHTHTHTHTHYTLFSLSRT